MERVVEPEPKTTNVEIEFEQETYELEFVDLQEDEKMESSSSGNRKQYGMVLGGFIAIAALLIVPLVTFPGMVILVLFAEVYLVDWTYDKVKQLRGAESAPARIRDRKDRTSQAEAKNSRTSPKDKFVK